MTLYNDLATNVADVSLYRVTESWGEGTSVATGNGDAGASPTTGDATWIHRFYPGTNWTPAGGSFVGAASATMSVTGAGFYAWTSATLAADIQTWIDNPSASSG